MKSVFSAVLAVFISVASVAAQASKGGEASRMVSIPQGAQWRLIGEWDYPGQEPNDARIRYTRSIIEMNGKYFRVHDGTLIAGCCSWPIVYELDERSVSVFWDAAYAETYVVNEDGTLSIVKKDGTIFKANKTPNDSMLSRKWK